MFNSLARWIVLVVVLSVGPRTFAFADDETGTASAGSASASESWRFSEQIAALKEEVARQGALLDARQYGAGSMTAASCADCVAGVDCCPCECRWCEGWYGYGELVLVSLRSSDDPFVVVTDGVTQNVVSAEYDFDPSVRVGLGYQMCSGLGLRAGWWGYENDIQPLSLVNGAGTQIIVPVPDNFPGITLAAAGDRVDVTQRTEFHLIDLEATGRFCLGPIDGQLALGVRYGYRETRDEARAVVGGAVTVLRETERLEGAGPTSALEFWYPLCNGSNGRLSLYANLRGSILFTDLDNDAFEFTNGALVSAVTRDNDPVITTLAQAQIGLQYTLGNLFARAAWEGLAQLGPGDSSGLEAVSLAAGFTR